MCRCGVRDVRKWVDGREAHHQWSPQLTSQEAAHSRARPDAVDVADAPLARLGHAVHGGGAAAGARGSRPDEQQGQSRGGKQREHRGGGHFATDSLGE